MWRSRGKGAYMREITKKMERHGMKPEYFMSETDVVIDGMVLKKGTKVYELTDAVEESSVTDEQDDILHEQILKAVSEVSERVAREMFPRIAERIIREEIELLKKDVDKT